MAHVPSDAILGPLTLTSVSQSDFTTNPTVRANRTSSGVDPAQVSAGQHAEVWSGTTTDLETMIDANSTTFLSAGLAVSSGTVTVPYAERDGGSTYKGAASHPALAGTDGLAICTGISAQQDSDTGATANVEFHFESQDGAKHCTATSGNSIASESFTNVFDLAKCLVNGAQLNEAVGATVNPGIEVHKQWFDGLMFPQLVSIRTRNPTIEITFEDLDSAVTHLNAGVSAGTACVVYLRERAAGSTHTADASLAHIKLSFAGGIINASVTGTNSANGQATVMYTGLALTGATDQAIP